MASVEASFSDPEIRLTCMGHAGPEEQDSGRQEIL